MLVAKREFKIPAIYVNPFPEMYHMVAATLTAVAIPYGTKVREPVAPVPAKYIVSVVIAIVVVIDAAFIITKVNPIGKATVPLAGIVSV